MFSCLRITPLIVIIALLMSVSMLTTGCQPISSGPNSTGNSESNMFYGLRQPSQAEILTLFPNATKQPVLVEFTSRFCLDCKRMQPIVKALLPQYPQIETHFYDVMKDKTSQQAVFNTFKPVTVPVMILIKPPEGQIVQVLYDYQSKETLEAAFQQLIAIKPEKHS